MTDRRRKEGRKIGERGAQPYGREERKIYEVMRNKEESREGGWEKQQGAMKKLVKVLEEGERERENKSAKGR